MRAKYIYITMAVFFYCQGQAQQLPENKKDTIMIEKLSASSSIGLPQIIPPSPKVSSMTKYGEYPVSLYTGLVDITVPVYTIQVNNIQVPIEFKYHASGIKYDDVSMEVGLGWSLIAGGTIDYATHGVDYPIFAKSTANIDPTGNCYNADVQTLLDLANGNRDYPSGMFGQSRGESNIYTYSFLKYSGQFCIPVDDSAAGNYSQAGALFTPADPLKLVDTFGKIVLLDDKGAAYTFEQMELSDNGKRKEYYLTKIISASKADTVLFKLLIRNKQVKSINFAR